MRFREAGLEPYGLFQLALRAIDGAGGKQQQAKTVVRLGIAGVGGDSLLEVICGLWIVVARSEEICQVVVRFGVVRLELERLAEELLRRVVIAFLRRHYSE